MSSELVNPSIDKLFILRKTEKLCALSEQWVEKRDNTKYVPLVLKNGKLDNKFALDHWLTEAEWFNKDLEFILGLSFHRFWSHVLYDKEFLEPLLFFLQESTPFYLPIRKVAAGEDGVADMYEMICRNVLVIVCRLITSKESETEWLTKEKHADILYKNFIISIPMLFDLVALYGYSNKKILQKIFETLLKIEPQYNSDLKSGIKFCQSTFEKMKQELDVIESENRDLFEKYEDLALYLLSVSITINLVVDLCPNDVKAYCSRELRVEQTISSFYDSFVPSLYQAAYKVDSAAWFLSYINYARVELINCFRSLLNRSIETILNAGDKNRVKFSDELLSTLTESAGYRTFIVDYTKLFSIENDLDVLEQTCKKIDDIKLNFVKEAYKDEAPSRATVSLKKPNGHHVESEDDDEMEGACALPLKQSPPKEVKSLEDTIQEETCKIMELFPDYGVGYIRKLLSRYNNSSEVVIATVLEGRLEADLISCNQDEAYIPPEVPDQVFMATGLERSNIYDGDKFDVMRQDDFGTGIIKKHGKNITNPDPKNYNELLNDKTHIDQLKNRYQSYGLVTENPEDDNEYNDEYDDSYEVFADTEPKINMRGRMRGELRDEVESESEEEEQPIVEDKRNQYSSGDRRPKDPVLDFCENPEVIRARREQQFQQKMAKKHPQRPQQAPQAPKDVVGGQKGQGQSNEVIRNRANKNTNKSSRANHNRKAGADFKASKGMF